MSMKSTMQFCVKSSYNKIAQRYTSNRDKEKNNQYLNQFNKLIEANSKILDLGCGAGKPIAEFFLNKSHSVIGLDISEKQIELAKNNFPKGEFVVKDISLLEKNEFTVDAVVSFYTIFHIPRELQLDLYKKINSFLNIGGRVMLTLGSFDWEGGVDDFYGNKMFWSQFSKEKNRKLIERAGFNIITDEIDMNDEFKHQIIIAEKTSDL